MSKAARQCECTDPGCTEHLRKSECKRRGRVVLRRIDTDDRTGTVMCGLCAKDALDSGLFG